MSFVHEIMVQGLWNFLEVFSDLAEAPLLGYFHFWAQPTANTIIFSASASRASDSDVAIAMTFFLLSWDGRNLSFK
jgi:hypothetical protein